LQAVGPLKAAAVCL